MDPCGKTRNDGNGNRNGIEWNGNRNGNECANSLVILTHSAVVARSTSALEIAVPIEFCCHSVKITAHELWTAVTEKGALTMSLQNSDPREPLYILFVRILMLVSFPATWRN